jgi:hypothetical protein
VGHQSPPPHPSLVRARCRLGGSTNGLVLWTRAMQSKSARGNNLAAGASIRCFARGGSHGRRFRGARLTTELGARIAQELRHAPNPIIRRARANRAETRLCWPAGRSSVGGELALRWNTGRGPQAAESASGADEAWSRGERWSSVGSALRCTGLPGFQSRASTGAQHGTRRNSESTGRIAL